MTILLASLTTSVNGFSDPSEPSVSFLFTHHFSDYELKKFDLHSANRLPTYLEAFKKYSALYQIPWTLLAAVAYQESKWDHDAISYTGVRGIMQITEKTAKQIGLTNLEDPIENIRGGAYYLRYLYDKTTPYATTPQRWAHALAAYNMGWGHFRDAYRLSIELGRDPYDWNELRDIIPLLEDEEYFVNLYHGFARGNESVDFVEKVFSYYTLLNSEIIAAN